MTWGRLEVLGRDGPDAGAPARGPEPPHSAIHRVLVLRHALQDDPGAVLSIRVRAILAEDFQPPQGHFSNLEFRDFETREFFIQTSCCVYGCLQQYGV